MSKKRSRQVAFSDEVTVVTAVSYPVEGSTGDSESKQQKIELEPDLVVSGDTVYEESLSLSPQKTDYKPGARLREQLESDSEPDDDLILYGKAKNANQSSDQLTEDDSLNKEGLDEEDLFAQERGTLQFDGDIKVTPFNLDEEMEEGRFDSEGNYYSFKEEEVTDNWLTNIDWSNVDEQGEMLSERKRVQFKEDCRKFLITKEKLRDRSQVETETTILTKPECLGLIISLLNPRETVTQALKRLKPRRDKETPRIKKQDLNMSIDDNKVSVEESRVGNKFAELTELADCMCYHRDYGIYSDSLERLQAKLVSHKQSQSSKCEVSSEVAWEYKTDEKEGSRVYGPFKSTQMLAWSSGGFFGEGVLVRRIDKKDGQFHSSKRIDFDIYT